MKKEGQFKILVFGFIFLLCLPFGRMLFSREQDTLDSENRRSASWPTLETSGQSNMIVSFARYFNDFNAYYTDHFGFRNELLAIFRFCKVSILGVNPFPEKVVQGTNHWYFLGNSFSDVIKESKGIIRFSESKLDLIENNIQIIRRDCEQKGIKLYVAIAPNKHTVYGEYLPIIKSKYPTKLEQLIFRMNRNQFNIIDLKNDFHLYSDKRLFYLHGTHWNSFGGFLGYCTLMNSIVQDFPGIKVFSMNDFNLDTLTSSTNDLIAMLSLKFPEEEVIMKPKYVSEAIQKKHKLPVPDYYTRSSNDYEIRYVNKSRKLKVLVFRDSFFDAMIPFFKESFGESVFIWSVYDRRLIDIEKPDLIICEVIEREVDFFDHIHL